MMKYSKNDHFWECVQHVGLLANESNTILLDEMLYEILNLFKG